MFEIFPNCQFSPACPYCGERATTVDIDFQGIHVLGLFHCSGCQAQFWTDLPCGHGRTSPVFLDTQGQSLIDMGVAGWVMQSLETQFSHRFIDTIRIDKLVSRDSKRVVIVNCLDYLYGHVLLKLFNAQRHMEQDPDVGVIVLIPHGFEWLVPDFVAETWVVHCSLGQLKNWYSCIHEFVQAQLSRFEHVSLSCAYSHPHFSDVDISLFTKKSRFQLSSFSDSSPQITVVVREDRLWFSGAWMYFVWRGLWWLKIMPYFRWFFVWIQHRLILKMATLIVASTPNARVSIVGLGRTFKYPSWIDDQRETAMSDAVEADWCALYSKSHVIVGVHGSNMILPTALAAGFVEILPYDRYGNILQDIALPYSDRRLLFLGRFVDAFATPKQVARHVCAIVSDFEGFYVQLTEADVIPRD
jgi:hypothetical protein